MLNKFNNLYNDILNNVELNGRLFYESSNGSIDKPNFSKIQYINISTAKEFYEISIPIKDNNIINEAHKDAEFSGKLINKIYNAQNFDKIEYFDIYQDFQDKKQIPIYIFKFDFSNPIEIVNIFRSFNIEYSLTNGTLKEKQEYEINYFKSLYQDCDGIFTYVETCAFIILNIETFTKTTIQHELFHYVQKVSNKNKNNIEFNENIEINELQLNNDQLRYLFNFNEFETHIKVNLINQLTELYYKKYKDVFSKKQFCSNFIRAVQKDPLNVPSNFLTVLSILKNNDNTSLRLFAACFIIKNKKFLNKAIEWLNDTFK